MAEVILTRQLIEGFSFSSSYGSYHKHAFPAPFTILEGQRYLVYWDGKTYESVAYAFTHGIYSVVGIGNPMQAGGEDNGDPYAISYNEEYGTLDYFSTEVSAGHTISVTLLDENAAPIFQHHSLTFIYASMFGMYLWESYGDTENFPDPTPFELIPGETYRVVWDSTPYDCVAVAVDSGGITGIGLGNFSLLGMGENTGEPFVLGVFADGSDTACLTSDEGSSHSIILYRLIPSGNEIILKNYSGEPVTYENVDAVMFDTPDGGTQVYTRGELIQGVSVVLDLKDGNQTVNTPEGTLARSATIIKPDTLVPENIRSGATIAGVEGEFLGDTEELALSLSMADGDMVITPTAEGKVISQVTIAKPESLIPENIAEGVEIGGVVGTFVGGGSIEGVYKVTFYSWDGQLLLERYCYQGDDCPCPVAQGRITVDTNRPNSTKFVYGDWNGWAKAPDVAVQVDVLKNVSEDMELYAAYEITYENIIPEQTLAFSYKSDDKSYECALLPGALTLGETYVVVWDGTPYTVTCKKGASGVINGSINISTTEYLGDPTLRKGFFGYSIAWKVSSTGHPFYIGLYNSSQISIFTQQSATSHTVWVYK